MLRLYQRATNNTKRKAARSERLFSLARLTLINFACLPWLHLCGHDGARDVPYASL